MSFDFFNTSHLAFGSKLTRAFKTLENLCDESERNMQNITNNLDYYSKFLNRNYRVAKPISPDSAAQAAQAYDLVNDAFVVNNISYDPEEEKVNVSFVYIDRDTDRITKASGSTTLKKGYAYYKESISNTTPESTIVFTEDENDSLGNLAFKFRVDKYDRLNLDLSANCVIPLTPKDCGHLSTVSYDGDVPSPYVADDYECVVCTANYPGAYWGIRVTLNETELVNEESTYLGNHSVLYLKPGSKVTLNRGTKIMKFRYD